MTLKEAEKKFELPAKTLEHYVSHGFIREVKTKSNVKQYEDRDFERLGLIDTLLAAGFTSEETKKYLLLTEDIGMDEEQIRMLQKRRRSLLNDIHKKQQLLDTIDYMIWRKRTRIS